VRLLCDVTLHMIEGELYQLTKNGDADITEDEHFDIIRRKTAYLFGGQASDGTALGDLWAYDLANDAWSQIDASGPPARFGHNAAWVDGIGLVVFAGQAGPTTFYGDLWAYDPDANRWLARCRELLHDPDAELDRIRRLGDADHHLVTDRLDLLGVMLREERAYPGRKLDRNRNCLGVPVSFGKGREARQVCEDEGARLTVCCGAGHHHSAAHQLTARKLQRSRLLATTGLRHEVRER